MHRVAKNYSLSPVHLGSPGEEISKKDLRTIIHRFKNLHQLQRQKIQNFLQPRQQAFLNLLPLLFHQNLPLLPGFISSETPAGISDYSPSQQTLKDAAHFSKNFNFKNRALPTYPIWGLFLMGSVSSIAFSKTSDMDIWLCHQSELSRQQLDDLQRKANAIEAWAATLNLEVHFFLIDSDKFKDGQDTPISTESSGTTQHYLLLEEFYRTAVYIAGRAPAWWLVPPEQEQHYNQYLQHLLNHRFILKRELIDFGSLESVPAEEFLTVTLWHLYKAISSPHKSLLKLLLMECYASEYPHTRWLCADMKKTVYQGNFNIEELDPYLLIQQKLESYLARAHSKDRIELARQSFYLKIMGLGNTEQDLQKKIYRTEFINKMASRWHWPEHLLPELTRQKSWDISKATREHKIILRHLSECCRMIFSFAGHHVHTDFKENEDLKLISRKLHSFLEKKPGKIEQITTQAILQTKEDELTLIETRFADDRSGWSLFAGRVSAADAHRHNAIKNSWSLTELLAWVIVNGLYHRKLQLHLDTKTLALSTNELRAMAEQIHDFLNPRLQNRPATLEPYRSPNKILHALIIVNMGETPEGARDNGMLLMSDRSDPLSYGKQKQCFVQTLQCLTLSGWGEITASRSFGLEGLFKILVDFINHHRPPQTIDDLTIVCNTSVHAKSIAQRIQKLFEALHRHFIPPAPNTSPRYILAGGRDYYVFQRLNNNVHYWSRHGRTEVLDELGRAQEFFSPTVIDRGCLDDEIIPTIYAVNRCEAIQIFFQPAPKTVRLYVVDEKGSLFMQSYALEYNNASRFPAGLDALLNHYLIFLENMINRNFFDASFDIEYYEMQRRPIRTLRYTPTLPLPQSSSSQELSIRVSGEQIDQGSSYTLYCNEQEFSTMVYGNRVFEAAAQYILEFRLSGQHYPIHISDIDVPAEALNHESTLPLQTLHFLKYKQKIENRLNSIVAALTPSA